MEKPSPSRSGWLIRSNARVAPSFERLDVDGACLGESFNDPTASCFIDDMDPAELFSMRWTTSDGDTGFDFGLPLLTTAAAGDVLPFPREPSRVARDGGAYADVVSSSASSPAFRSAQSTPAASVVPARSGSRRSSKDNRTAPLLATRRLLLRYLRFLAPLCRKARSSLAPRSGSGSGRAPSVTAPARRSASSTSSVLSAAAPAEHWCHGNADTAVRDAILYCKKSFTARAEC